MHGGSLKIENIIMAVLRLSDDHHLWLANLSSANLFTDENFTQFMEDLAQSLLQAGHKIAHLDLDEGNPANILLIKQVIAGSASLLIEAAKRDSAVDSVGLYLQSIGIPERRVRVIMDVYTAKKQALRKLLSKISINLPQVTDVDWRFDWNWKSNFLSRIGEPSYQVELQTLSQTDGLKSIAFGLSVEELQDLVWNLKSAIKSVENHCQ